MPEGPEVERVRMSLEKYIIDRSIVDVKVTFDKAIKQQSIDTFLLRIKHQTIKKVERRGKYLIINTLDNQMRDHYIITHLAMTGALLYVKDVESIEEKYKKHIHITLPLDNGHYLVYSDIRKFGGMRIFNLDEYQNYSSIQDMGPEVHWRNADQVFLSNIRKKKYQSKEIKGVLLDQSIVAGVGNIYACECLYVTCTDPQTLVKDLSDSELLDIFHAVKEVMLFSVSVGGSSFSDYVDGEGQRGNFQKYMKVYGQKYCECGNVISTVEIAGRTTHYCQVCQPVKVLF